MRRRQPPAEPAKAPASVPAALLDPLFAEDWPGGAAEVEQARSEWLAAHGRHDHLREVREWQVQDVILQTKANGAHR